MNNLGLWCDEKLGVMDVMNNQRLWFLKAKISWKRDQNLWLWVKPLKGDQNDEKLTFMIIRDGG